MCDYVGTTDRQTGPVRRQDVVYDGCLFRWHSFEGKLLCGTDCHLSDENEEEILRPRVGSEKEISRVCNANWNKNFKLYQLN